MCLAEAVEEYRQSHMEMSDDLVRNMDYCRTNGENSDQAVSEANVEIEILKTKDNWN